MKKLKISDQDFRETPLNPLANILKERARAFASLQGVLHGCFVPSAEGGKPTVDPFAVRATLPKLQEVLSRIAPDAVAHLHPVKAWVESLIPQLQARFGAALTAYCNRNNLTIEGHFPTFVVAGFLSIQVNEQDALVEVGSYKIRTVLFDAIAPVLAEAVSAEKARPFDRAEYIETLARAYQRAATLSGLQAGDFAKVTTVYQELLFCLQPPALRTSGRKQHFTEYTTDLFSRDLVKLLASSPCQTKSGLRLECAPTTFANEGLPILQSEGVRFIGRIAFRKESIS